MMLMVRNRLEAVMFCNAQENMKSGTAFHLAGSDILSSASGHHQLASWSAYSALLRHVSQAIAKHGIMALLPGSS